MNKFFIIFILYKLDMVDIIPKFKMKSSISINDSFIKINIRNVNIVYLF